MLISHEWLNSSRELPLDDCDDCDDYDDDDDDDLPRSSHNRLELEDT